MELLTHVTFLAPDFEEPAPPRHAGDEPEPEVREPVPPGRDMARFLDRTLGERGWEVLNRWTTPYGHAFDVRRTKQRYDIEIQRVEGDEERWLVSAVPRRGLIPWGKRVKDSDEHTLLLTHLRGLLAQDPRIAEPRWYSEDDWNAPARGPGHDLPIA
ncbi:MAG: hypothetical protein EP329_08770 [Deltaproteobacteria bacterium]|nr:MAG: hypothetical protein EP329_08770 [Deltaproteobacteria bacterium]